MKLLLVFYSFLKEIIKKIAHKTCNLLIGLHDSNIKLMNAHNTTPAVPFVDGCGTVKPGIWKRDPVFALGLSSMNPQVQREPMRSTRLRRACTASSDSLLSIL